MSLTKTWHSSRTVMDCCWGFCFYLLPSYPSAIWYSPLVLRENKKTRLQLPNCIPLSKSTRHHWRVCPTGEGKDDKIFFFRLSVGYCFGCRFVKKLLFPHCSVNPWAIFLTWTSQGNVFCFVYSLYNDTAEGTCSSKTCAVPLNPHLLIPSSSYIKRNLETRIYAMERQRRGQPLEKQHSNIQWAGKSWKAVILKETVSKQTLDNA